MKPSITQNFLMCALNKRGYLNCNDRYLLYGIITGTVIELVDAGALEVWDKHAKIIGPLPEDKPWLEPMYNIFIDETAEATLSDAATRLFIPVLTDARARATLEYYWPSLEEGGFLERKPSLLGKYVHKIVNQEYFEALKAKLYGQFTGKDPYDAELTTLLFMLKYSQCIQNVLPGVSGKQIKQRLEQIEDDPEMEAGVRQEFDRNRDLISCVSFATSALGGGIF